MRSNMCETPESGNVIAFPTKTQSAERLRAGKIVAAAASTPARPIVYDGAWYHAEAIEEDRAAREGIRRLDH